MADAVAGAEIGAPAAGMAPASLGYRRLALWLLMLVYVVNFLDRQVVNIVAEKIKLDLHLTNLDIGWVSGGAFAIFYTLLGIPIARAAERFSRPLILASSMAIWSGFTVVCGLSANFVQLLLGRLGVGFGEAGCNPTAHSMIADDTPAKDRAYALSFYAMGTPIGAFLGFAIGGVVADALGWRAAFFVAGAPGLLLALVAALALKEPRRRMIASAAERPPTPSFTATMAYLFSKPTFWFISLFAGLSAFVGYGQNAFITSFYIRNHGPAVEHLGALFGLKSYGFLGVVGGAIGGLAGAAGSVIGGRLSDRAGGRDPRAFATLPAVVSVVWIPTMLAQVLVPNAALSLVISAAPSVLGTFWYGPVYATAQSVVPPQMRATTAAILIFMINFIGLLFGPPCFGAFNDVLAGPMGLGQAEGLRWTFVASCAIVLPAVALLLMARRTIARDIVS